METTVPGPTRAHRLPLYALMGANAVSVVGNQLTGLAIPWLVLQTTGSAAKMGLVAFTGALPAVLAAFLGGAIVDRFGPKRICILSDVMSGATVALVALLYAAGALNFGVLLALVFLGALLDPPGGAARQALIPNLARGANLSLERANGVQHTVGNAAGLTGPLLAGLLVASVGISNVLWLDAASFAISAAAIAVWVPAAPAPPAETTPAGYWTDVVEGVRFVARDRLLRALIVSAAILNLLGTPLFAVVLPVFAKQVYGSPVALGLLLAGLAGGHLAGSLLFGAVGDKLPRRAILIGGLIIMAVPVGALALEPPLAAATAALAVAGFALGPVNPLIFTLLQERTPPELRGRVFGTVLGSALVAAPLGMLLAGASAESLGLGALLLIVAGGLLVTSGSMLINPAFRSLGGRGEATDGSD